MADQLLPLFLPRRVVALSVVSLWAPPLLPAQDLNRVMPEPVPQQVEAPAAPAPTDYASLKAVLGGAAPDEQVILAELKGLVFLRDETELGSVRLAPGQASNLADRPELVAASIDGIVEVFVGQSVSKESLLRLRLAVSMMLAQSGRPFSVAYMPPQDITDGIVQLVVRQSEVAAVRVEGAKYFSEESYRSLIDQPIGSAVDSAALQAGVARINRNSFRQAVVRAEKGATPGTTDIVLQVRDRLPWRVFTGYSNTGSSTTTEDRINTGVNWGNAFGLGHQMTLQWTSDLESRYSRSVSANYVFDLPHNHAFTIFGAYSEIESVPSSGFSQEGLSWQVGLNYDLPLRSREKRFTHNLQFGTDFKYSDNNLEFAIPPFVIPISNNRTHIAQVRVEYRGTLSDAWGSTSFGAKLTGSPGGLTDHNNDAAFSGSRAMAQADYVYGSFDVFRQTALRGGLQGWSWTVTGRAQIASGNLLGSEQFSGGGMGSVRGYEQGETVGDNAILLSQEFASPMMQPLKKWLGLNVRDALTPYVFQDFARLWNVDKLAGEQPFTLHSVGVGLRYQFSTHGTVQLAQGWQLRDSGSSDTGDNSRLHISGQISF